VSVLYLPGLFDAHVHLREPGATHKEDISSGTRAALAGGVVAVLDMPNNQPPISTSERLQTKADRFSEQAVCDYGLFCTYSGGPIGPILDVAPRVCGLKLYLDQTFGDILLSDLEQIEELFAAWPGPGPIAVHAEPEMIDWALQAAQRHGQAVHICHVPTPDALIAIDRARQAGTSATCEITPHHLFLDHSAEKRMGSRAQMKPPLLPPPEVARFWQHLDLVDVIASDHAPHTLQEKAGPTPPPGVPGLETTLPLLLMAVDQDCLDLDHLTALTWHNPFVVYGLRPPTGCCVDVVVNDPYRFPARGYATRCDWSPFAGLQGLGRVHRVQIRHATVWQNGRLLATPGSGRPLVRREDKAPIEAGGCP